MYCRSWWYGAEKKCFWQGNCCWLDWKKKKLLWFVKSSSTWNTWGVLLDWLKSLPFSSLKTPMGNVRTINSLSLSSICFSGNHWLISLYFNVTFSGSTEGLMEKGREGLLCVLKRRLCEVEAQLATARTTYKSILGLQTLPLDDFSEEGRLREYFLNWWGTGRVVIWEMMCMTLRRCLHSVLNPNLSAVITCAVCETWGYFTAVVRCICV